MTRYVLSPLRRDFDPRSHRALGAPGVRLRPGVGLQRAPGGSAAALEIATVVERLAHIAGPPTFSAWRWGRSRGMARRSSFNTFHGLGASLSHSVVGALMRRDRRCRDLQDGPGVKGSTGSIFVGPFSLGISVGRWGCLFAGLPALHARRQRCAGSRSSGRHFAPPGSNLRVPGDGRLPGGVSAGAGAAQKLGIPAQLLCDGGVYGGQRFVWEFLKPYPTLLGPFNIFHAICLGISVYGCVFFARDLQRERRAKECAIPVLRANDEPVRDLPGAPLKNKAEVIVEDDCVFYLKRCPDHGVQKTLISDDVGYWKATKDWLKPGDRPLAAQTRTEHGCPAMKLRPVPRP